jgi:predicted RecB family nuclease
VPPPSWRDPVLAVLQERGLEHERGFVEGLRAQKLTIVDLSDHEANHAIANSIDAMRSGVDVIVQAALRGNRWFGRPDVLRRVERQSSLGVWSYEVIDTKLAKDTSGGTVLQLALYSDLLTIIQGMAPELFHVVTPDPAQIVHTFRLQDFASYFRLIRGRLEVTSLQDPDVLAAANYPQPVDHCSVCRWWETCDKLRRSDDHLSLVAGISRLQIREFESAGVITLAQLGALPFPLPFVPRRGAAETYLRVRNQARVQFEGRILQAPVHELLPIEPDHGLTRLPAPSVGDVFLDLEGDPFARDGGREYLFGVLTISADGFPAYESFWAFSDAEERIAFESVVDGILRSWEANAGMHVYHYAPYEPSAFKRLMGRHATREAEVDRMLRAPIR